MQSNWVPTLSFLSLLFGPKLVITARTLTVRILTNAGTLAPRVANWLPKFNGILFSALGTIQGHKVQHLLVALGQIENIFSISALSPSVKPLRLISTLAPIRMLDLG
jgi:hypothetical protein